MITTIFRKTPLSLAIASVLLHGTALAYESPVHVFSINDVMP
jgi:hypothetical protein